MKNSNIIAVAGVLVFFASCSQINRINANDPDGVAYSPDYYLEQPNSSSSVDVVYSSSSRPVSSSSSSRAVSSSSAARGVYCRIDAGDFGRVCYPELVYDNCKALIDEGYSAEVDSSCGV